MKLFSLENSLKYLFLLLPITIITGPFLADANCSLLALLFLINSFKKSLKYYYINKIAIIFFIFSAYLIFTSMLSTDFILSLESTLFYFRFGFFSLSIWYILNQYGEEILRKFYIIFLIVFIYVIFDGYFQYFFGVNTLGYHYNNIRLSGLFGSEFILGSYLSRLFLLLFSLSILLYNKKKIILINLIILILTDILIYLSGERSAFVYLIIGTLVIIFLTADWKKIRIASFAITIFILTILTLSNDNLRYRLIDYTLKQTNLISLFQETEISNNFEESKQTKNLFIFSPQHEAHYLSALKMFNDNKLIGVGPKIFRKLCSDDRYYVYLRVEDRQYWGCQTHPHNTYIQLLAETGIIGFLPIFIIFMFITFLFVKHFLSKYILRRKLTSNLNDFQICLLATLYLSLWPIIPTGSFFNNWLSVIYYLPVGFLLYSFNYKSLKLK